MSSDGDRSTLHIPKAGDELPCRGFSSPGWSYQRGEAPGRNFYCQMIQRHAAQRVGSVLIGKAHILKHNFSFTLWGSLRSLGYGLHIQHLVNLIHAYCQVPQICSELHKFHQGTDAGGTDYQEHQQLHHKLMVAGMQVQQCAAGNKQERQHGDCDGLICAENRRDTLQIDLPMLPVLLHQPCQAAGCRFRSAEDFFFLHARHIFRKRCIQLGGGTVQVAPYLLTLLSAESGKLDEKRKHESDKDRQCQRNVE